MRARPCVVLPEDETAAQHELTGAKATALATARWHGLPTVPGFVPTVDEVERVATGEPPSDHVVQARRGLAEDGREPLAVLVQPLLRARSGGVLFGIDPVPGREDRLVVAAVEGAPRSPAGMAGSG